MRTQLSNAINLIDKSLTKLKSYSSTSATTSVLDTKKSTATDRFGNSSHSHQNSSAHVVINPAANIALN